MTEVRHGSPDMEALKRTAEGLKELKVSDETAERIVQRYSQVGGRRGISNEAAEEIVENQ